jgi:hypothetical protein
MLVLFLQAYNNFVSRTGRKQLRMAGLEEFTPQHMFFIAAAQVSN